MAIIRNSFFILGLLLASCGSSSHWVSDQIHSEQKQHCSTKLCYLSQDPVHGIDLELVQTQEQLRAYLVVHSTPVPAYQKDPKQALLKITINSETSASPIYRFEGGQRFLLPPELACPLIEALKNNHEVSLSLSGYRTLIKPEDFSSKFEHFQHPFPLQNPFHLPL